MLKIKIETEYPGNCIYLVSEEAVQREFLRIVENISKGKEPFWDKDSLMIMEAVDGARREGDYTIVTGRGKGCMHSLSYECQIALVLAYGQRRYRVPRAVRLAIMSTQTLALLNSMEMDIEILLPVKEGGDWILPEQIKALELLAAKEQFEVNGEMIGAGIEDWQPILGSIVSEIEYFHRGMDPAREAKAFRNYFNFWEKERVISGMKQELAMPDFLGFFGIQEPEFDHFRVFNTCRVLDNTGEKQQRMLIVLDEDGVHQYNVSVKGFGDMLMQILDMYRGRRGRFFALLTKCEPEDFRTTSYPEQTQLGVMVDLDKAEITICHKHLAIRAFHQMFVDAFGDWGEEDA